MTYPTDELMENDAVPRAPSPWPRPSTDGLSHGEAILVFVA
jgi:hypothetical protein